MTEPAMSAQATDPEDALRSAASLLGRKGGQSTLARHGVEHFVAAGRAGGKAASANRPPGFYQSIGRMGGNALKAKLGVDYFRQIAKGKSLSHA